MQDYRLTPEQQQSLKQAHRTERNKKKVDRIKAVYLLSEGWPVKTISKALLLGEDTIRLIGLAINRVA